MTLSKLKSVSQPKCSPPDHRRYESGANLLTFFLYGALGGTLFFLPLNLIQVQHYAPTAAGATLLPLILIIFLLSRWSGGLVERCGAKIPLLAVPTGPLFSQLSWFLGWGWL